MFFSPMEIRKKRGKGEWGQCRGEWVAPHNNSKEKSGVVEEGEGKCQGIKLIKLKILYCVHVPISNNKSKCAPL